jgi:Protein of unknown function (DUF3277)
MSALYDPAQILMTFNGIPIVGYADGTFVEVERNEDSFTLLVGADGKGVRSRNQNRSGRIRFTLLQVSPSNDVLSQAAQADEVAGAGVGACQVKDNFGSTVVHAPNAWVLKPATVSFAKEAGTREWEIETDYLTMTVGGSR